jgi:hypothetical protein
MNFELILKSMGLGGAIEDIKKLIASGALQKIMEFGNGLPEITRKLDEANARLAALEQRLQPLGSDGPDRRAGASSEPRCLSHS